MDKTLKEAVSGYREKLRGLCNTEPIAQRCFDMVKSIGLSEDEAAVMIAVHALECLKSTQQALLEAQMELPPDAFYIRNEDGSRSLVRYIGPTIKELKNKAKEHHEEKMV